MAKVEFHFDFGSPNAYLAHKVVPILAGRTKARVTYVPILLGGVFKATNNKSPMEAFGEVKNKLAYERLQMDRFIARHGLTDFAWNPHFPINTLTIMRGVGAARREGCFGPYVETMFKAMWEFGENMGNPATIEAVLNSAGLPAERLIALTHDPDVKAELIANTEASVERGTFGAPTFYVDDQIFFGKDSLGDVEVEILRRAGTQP